MDSGGTGSSAGATASTPIPTSNASLELLAKLAPSVPTQLPNGYPGKSSLSLELETDDSTSSDDQVANPFHPDSSVSDNENDPNDDDHPRRSSTSSAFDDRPREIFGSAPHPAPSADGSTATPSLSVPFTSADHAMRPGTEARPNTSISISARASHQHQSVKSLQQRKKPPPPPRSHHGRRISASARTSPNTANNLVALSFHASSSHASPPRSTNRLSYHASSPESQTSARPLGTPNASSASQSLEPDYFSVSSEDQQQVTDSTSTESLHRSHSQRSQNSQHKRPPTPPLSRRHSQMRRSKSTQSKSSGSRLTMSSRGSENAGGSQPPSPGPSTRSVASSLSQDRKRISMPPPPSSGERDPRAPGPPGLSAPDALSPAPVNLRWNPSPPDRRASSHGSIPTDSSTSTPAAPPPPPPPRRARDSKARSSDSRPVSQVTGAENIPLPQPSNAHDILADLSRLQKEVDDLRGHYENRKVSQ
ncbi:uncharacterized protein N7482_009387 [Penicillium canariense]|uniref:Uncharacterized protein n=1 Tax=Penicillium canariense TaxID=189055 RepID=A0A9W9HT45_9EURO|nr:uncharacterized protein N7482_009387 [Penicillium canariense]KAJ5152909.1 hypothetical protein N7482_009387 [Penicillium canariense]